LDWRLICDGLLRDLEPGIWDSTDAVDSSDAAVVFFGYSALSPHSDLVNEIGCIRMLGKSLFYDGFIFFTVCRLPVILQVRLVIDCA
jgi:hypothetical protein